MTSQGRRIVTYAPGGCPKCRGTLLRTPTQKSCLNCGYQELLEDEGGLYSIASAPTPEPIRLRMTKARLAREALAAEAAKAKAASPGQPAPRPDASRP